MGWFACHRDIEEELIRALGPDTVIDLIRFSGESKSWERLSWEPAQRGRPVEARLRRFFGSQSGRKLKYGALLAGALEPAQVPAPLQGSVERLGRLN